MVVSPSSRTSVVWKHFGFAKDDSGKLLKDNRTICKLCCQKVAHGGGTTNLKNHLETKHRPVYNELFANNTSDKDQSSLDAFVQPVEVTKLPPHSSHAMQLTDTVVEFLAHDLRQVSVVDGKGFLHLMQVSEPCYVVPCRKKMMNVIDIKYTELKRTVRGAMIGGHRITLTTNGMWTSQAGEGYFSLTAHYVSADFHQCHPMPGKHNHSHLSEAIHDSLSEWCIDLDKYVAAFTTVIEVIEEQTCTNFLFHVQDIHSIFPFKRLLYYRQFRRQ